MHYLNDVAEEKTWYISPEDLCVNEDNVQQILTEFQTGWSVLHEKTKTQSMPVDRQIRSRDSEISLRSITMYVWNINNHLKFCLIMSSHGRYIIWQINAARTTFHEKHDPSIEKLKVSNQWHENNTKQEKLQSQWKLLLYSLLHNPIYPKTNSFCTLHCIILYIQTNSSFQKLFSNQLMDARKEFFI